MPTCFLHIGAHKTGTTAIQWFATENRDVLARYNVLYPETGANRTGSHLPLLKTLFGRPAERGMRTEVPRMQDNFGRSELSRSERGRAAFERELQAYDGTDLLISAEDLENRVVTSTFDPVVKRLRQYGYDVHVIMYVRHQPQYMNSQYVQKVKVFNFLAGFEEYIADCLRDPRYRYSTIANEMDRLDVPFIARPYNKAVRDRGIAWDLLHHVIRKPVDQTLFAPLRRANVSLGPVAVAAIQVVQKRLQERGLLLDHRQRMACKALFLDESKGPRWPEERSFYALNTSLARRIENLFAEDNDAFARRMFGQSWRETFPEDVGVAHESNVFDPLTAGGRSARLYAEMLDQVWPKSLAIAARAPAPATAH